MSLSLGIVGLPNVGKSTLFNALVKSSVAQAANYPFCTIEPNVGIVDVPDDKLARLAQVAKSAKIVPAVVEFVDIAGLVKGASQGAGLGNKFLSHIRAVDAVVVVLRCFDSDNIINVESNINPKRDLDTLDLELMLADMATLIGHQGAAAKEMRAGKNEVMGAAIDLALGEIAREHPLRLANFTQEQTRILQSLSLLTLKPLMVVLNVDEAEAGQDPLSLGRKYFPAGIAYPTLAVSAQIESEIATLPAGEAREFTASLGWRQSGLDRVAMTAYDLLGLQSFYTAGEKETRAWTIRQGTTAPQAAGAIHGDFERGFIAAEVMSFADFIALEGWSAGRAAGKMRTEGKTYVMRPDDIVLFRFNV